jgi:transcriptional regulator with XRE-family HTH domain
VLPGGANIALTNAQERYVTGRERLAARRRVLGLSQADLAERLGVHVQTVAGWEQGRSTPRPWYRPVIAEALRVGLEELDDLLVHHHDPREPAVDRRQFLVNAVALAAATRLPAVEPARRLGAEDVDRLRSEINTLYLLDDQVGGATAHQAAIAQLGHIKDLLDTATFGSGVEHDLRVIAGQLTEHAGWSAYDAGRQDESRLLLNEALTVARMADSDRLATLVLTTMSLQATTHGGSRDAVALADAAQRAAKPFATPRLTSLLYAREALAQARAGNSSSCYKALVRAEALMDEHQSGEDDDWLAFWGPADLFWSGAVAQLALGDAQGAEHAGRCAIDAADPAYPRNEGLYLAVLAKALIDQGTVDESASNASAALTHAGQITSVRLHDDLRSLRRRLGDDTNAAARGYVAAYEALGLAS